MWPSVSIWDNHMFSFQNEPIRTTKHKQKSTKTFQEIQKAQHVVHFQDQGENLIA